MTLKIDALSMTLGPSGGSSRESEVLIHAERGIFGVADGFGGGGESGSKAAKTSLSAVSEFLVREAGDRDATLPFVLKRTFSFAGNILFNSLVHANRKLIQVNRSAPVSQKAGASLVVGYFDGPLMVIGGVGSTEAWLLRDGVRTPLILPRTLSRMLSPGVHHTDPFNQIPLVGIGLFEDLEPDVHEYRIRKGDRILFSSSGLSQMDLDTLLPPDHLPNIGVAFPNDLSALQSGDRRDELAFVFLCVS